MPLARSILVLILAGLLGQIGRGAQDESIVGGERGNQAVDGQVTIRQATAEDVPKLRELYKELGAHLEKTLNEGKPVNNELLMITHNEKAESSSNGGQHADGKVRQRHMAQAKEKFDGIILEDKDIRDHFREGLMECWLAVTKDGAFVGYALYYFAASSTENRIMHLEDFFVDTNHRRRSAEEGQKGLAYQLFIKLAEKARDHSVASIEWTVPGQNDRALSFYNKQPQVQELVKHHKHNYWRLDEPKFAPLVEKAKELVEQYEVRVDGNSCGANRAHARQLATNWAKFSEHGNSSAGHEHVNMAKLFVPPLGTITVREGPTVVAMALFHCDAYSTWTGPYIWLDNFRMEQFKKAEQKAVDISSLVMAKLAEIALELGAKRIEWTSPMEKMVGKKADAADEAHPTPKAQWPFDLLEKLDAINMSSEEHGKWLLYRWPKSGFEEKLRNEAEALMNNTVKEKAGPQLHVDSNRLDALHKADNQGGK